MCGIAGMLDLRGRRTVDRVRLTAARDALTHRGPDEAGLFDAPGIGLAHRRLSIVDLASGQQPMHDGHGLSITYNGEVYNHRNIAAELVAKGHVLRTASDTEVVLHAYREWGAACLDRLRGMFAFAVWDAAERTLFLARDRLGVKPLLHAVTRDGWFVFASEIKALLAVPGVDRDLRPDAMEDYFALDYVPDPKTVYRHIHKLEPGHRLTVREGGSPRIERWWDAAPDLGDTGGDRLDRAGDPRTDLVERLGEAVGIRLMAEVPLGAFLSGGVDSGAVVSLMAERTVDPVTTCSIGFDAAAFDESAHASAVAGRYATDHHVERVSGDEPDPLGTVLDTYDEPFADGSALPTLRVCELARRHVTVALSGDGADEVLAGYRRQRLHMNEERVRSVLPQRVRRTLFGPLARIYPKADWAPRALRAKTTLRALSLDSVGAYHESVSRNARDVREGFYTDDFLATLDGYRSVEVFREHAARAPARDPLSMIQYLDIKTYLAGDILTKVDRASMAHSLEVRVPFLDHPFVEWALGLPERERLSNGVGKRVLKEAMASRLPSDLLLRRKQGFSVPMATWLRGPLRERVRRMLDAPRLRDSGLIDPGRVAGLVREHDRGARDNAASLWSLLVFDGFLEREGEISTSAEPG